MKKKQEQRRLSISDLVDMMQILGSKETIYTVRTLELDTERALLTISHPLVKSVSIPREEFKICELIDIAEDEKHLIYHTEDLTLKFIFQNIFINFSEDILADFSINKWKDGDIELENDVKIGIF